MWVNEVVNNVSCCSKYIIQCGVYTCRYDSQIPNEKLEKCFWVVKATCLEYFMKEHRKPV